MSRVNRYLSAVRAGVLVFVALYSGVLCYGLYAEDVLTIYLLCAPICLALAGLVSARHLWRSGEALKLRRQMPDQVDVEVGKWRAEQGGYVRRVSIGDKNYELRLISELGAFRGAVREPASGDSVAFHRLARVLPALDSLVRQGIAGKVESRRIVETELHISAGNQEILLSFGSRYSITRNSVWVDREQIAVRDVLGWRVKPGLFPRHSMTCALVIGFNFPNAVKS
ncbi:hypothetical protein E1265_07475 [Streptomyces sp. 8K308]|uniref:hypothetical protein n=1 Tax=Streptomyces sp. 8K308 TaxID=2530388 RepID=UPI00104FE3EA|nr:hypothetical protein [Streptomyces sp. 8K308]TDC25294.1 hypothetical protein E1265_07475 [Streptomyces sp. 8K308]